MTEQKRYSQYENAWNKSEKRVNTELKLAQGFNVADIYLNRTYLENFSAAPIVPASRNLLDSSKIRIIEISKLVYDKNEKFIDKLKSVYSALHSLESAVSLIIDSDGKKIRFFIGIRSFNNAAIAGDVLESTLKGNFPGIRIRSLSIGESDDLIEGIQKTGIKSLASVSMVPSMREKEFETDSFVQGIEKFIDTLSGKAYTAICIATPLDNTTMQKRKHGYEELCSALSPHAKLSVAFGENESFAVNESISASFSKSVNRSVSNSNTNSTSRSNGTNFSSNNSSSYNGGYSSDGWSLGWGGSNGYSNGSFDSYTSGNSFTQSVSDSTGSSSTEGRTEGTTDTKGTSKTITLNYENKGVSILMERSQAELERFKVCESFGMWEFCGYFMSRDIHTTALAGNTYKALMTGDNSNVESAHLNVWSINQSDSINKVLEYILHFAHPQAEMPAFEGGYTKQLVTPTNLVSGYELPLVMGFPKKSVSGLAVVQMAEFGRAVVYENKIPERKIDFGNIYHMGITEKTRVNMDLDLLASHCFITGSSGSGKSYATYQLLESVIKNDVKIMVIEPAKGEYKQIFGGLKGVKIFTTDTNAYRVLKINPFQFPENIHLLSHIEQLLQIFNASWPLYAAMPAILKQAVVDAYVRCGWDVQNSIWIPGICDHKYPVFADVLDILPQIINTSDYSADSKGDYKGALVTRVQAMTGLEITRDEVLCGAWMNQYPVVFLTLKDIDGLTFEDAYERLAVQISNLYKEHAYLLESERMDSDDRTLFKELKSGSAGKIQVGQSLHTLIRLMRDYYQKPVILLLDEYDVPMAKASSNGYYDQMLDIMKEIMSTALKDNTALRFAVITGCLKIVKESIFTGTNNFVSDNITDSRFNEYF